MPTTSPVEPESLAEDDFMPQAPPDRWFAPFAIGATFVVTALLWGAGLARNDGFFLYTLDDAAIHQSMARQLIEHGTWGVSEGDYASASSSPGWTLLLAATTGIVPFARDALPLLLNLAAAFWIIRLFARNQTFLGPPVPNWLVALSASVAAVVLWFLPGLAFVGMEHTLHAALAVQAFVLFQRLQGSRGNVRSAVPLSVVLLLSTLIRYESTFLALGFALALLIGTTPRFRDGGVNARWSRAAAGRIACLALGASALPVIMFGVINLAFGEDILPNSVVAKTALQGGAALLRTPDEFVDVLGSDPALLALVLFAAGYLAVAASGGKRRHAMIAIAFVIATLLHAQLADFGWYERYQAYLILSGSYVALQIAGEVLTPARRTAALTFAVVLALALSTTRAGLTLDTPVASSNTYRQRYQLARFLQQYYDRRGILTGELGYTTYLHDGPVVDIYGLGSHDVVVQRRRNGPFLSAAFMRDQAERHGVEVMAFFAAGPGFEIPPEWTLVGEWHLNERRVSSPDPDIQFYAPTDRLAAELAENLDEFAAELPSRVDTLDRDDLVERYVRNLR